MAADFGFDPVKEGARYFISYTVEDRERVGEVVRCLNRAGVPLWYDRGLEYGREWERQISLHISECEALILFATRHLFTVDDDFVSVEYDLASGLEKKIFVVWLEDFSALSEVDVAKRVLYVRMKRLQGIFIKDESSSEVADWMIRAFGLKHRLPDSLIDLDKQPNIGFPNHLTYGGSGYISSTEDISNHEAGGSEYQYQSFDGSEVNNHGSGSSETKGAKHTGIQTGVARHGIYFNPGSYNFEEALNSAIYVDKTELIWYLNSLVRTRQKYVSVSRPRRFGKTMAADMLCAYYGAGPDRHELFSNLKLSRCEDITVGRETLSWDMYLGKFDVLRIVMTDFIRNSDRVRDMLAVLTSKLCDELENAYSELRFYDAPQADLIDVMNIIHASTGHQFVVIIDEWDAIFRIRKEDKDGQTEYLNFLRDWLKDKPYIALAYMTGILPIKKYGEHSALNMFTEYSMIAPIDGRRTAED